MTKLLRNLFRSIGLYRNRYRNIDSVLALLDISSFLKTRNFQISGYVRLLDFAYISGDNHTSMGQIY